MISSWTGLLMQHRAIAVIRAPELEIGRSMAITVATAGLKLIEVTWNSDRPSQLLELLREDLPDCILGAGTILTCDQLEEAVTAGAQFIFSPHTDEMLIRQAQNLKVPIVTGALTPTEIVKAWQMGASSVKVFPVKSVGGVNYLRCLKSPLEGIPLVPTGGVTVENAVEFLDAGAIAVGLSSELFLPSLVADRDWEGLRDRTEKLILELESYCHFD